MAFVFPAVIKIGKVLAILTRDYTVLGIMDPVALEKKILEKDQFNPYATLTHEGKTAHYSLGSRIMLWRVHTLFSKEPETLEWISGFSAEDVLIDVGANVGMYSIWAAVMRGTKVIAFEPESQNYAALNKNIHLNKISDKLRAYCVALSDETAYDALHLAEFASGGSNHTFGEDVDFNLKPRNSLFHQGCFATTLDKMVADGHVPVPTHIKIDVDGIEHKVISGMMETLAQPQVQSVLIELNTALPEHQGVIATFRSLGLDHDDAKTAESLGRQKGTPFEGVGNHIFRRLKG